MQALIPNGQRSATAAPGDDILDIELYSAGVLQHGAKSTITLFQQGEGAAIPASKGSAINASAAAHHQKYGSATTNIKQSGQLGNAIGDVAVRGMFITIETAGEKSDGTLRDYGATPTIVAEIQGKCFVEFKIGKKELFKSQLFRVHSGGGPVGAISTTRTASTVGIVTNGQAGMGRRLKFPILAERTDTLAFNIGVAENCELDFNKATADGQPVLVWVNLACNNRGEVR